MNSTIDSHSHGLPSSISSHSTSYLPMACIAIVLAIVLSVALICFFVKLDRSTNRLYRLLFRFASSADSSLQTIPSPDENGRLEPPVWCRTCNEFVDHVNKMCSHVGRKLYASSLHRRFYERWRRQLFRRYRPVYHPQPNVSAAPDCTVDLDDLIGSAGYNRSVDRQPSAASLVPCRTSTPTGDRCPPSVRRGQNQLGGLSRVRSTLQSWRSRRRVSNASSGVGSSIGSVDQEQPEANRSTTFVKRLGSNPRRWLSDIAGSRASAPKIVRRPTPFVVIHRCSTRRQCPTTSSSTSVLPNSFLRVDGTWNGRWCGTGQQSVQRSFSQSCVDNHCRPPTVQRSCSTVAGASPRPAVASIAPQPYFDLPQIVHALADGSGPQINDQGAAVAISNDSPSFSFSEYLGF